MGIWSLAVPSFCEHLDQYDLDPALVHIIQGMDEYSAMHALGLDVKGTIDRHLAQIVCIMDRLDSAQADYTIKFGCAAED